MTTAALAFDVVSAPHEAVVCALCGPSPTTVVVTEDRYTLPTRIVQCDRCGLRFITPRMTADAYAQFYRHGYRPLVDSLHAEPVTLADIEANQWVYAANMANAVAPYLRETRTLLDVGGSTGIVGRVFKARWGFDVTVIDPAPEELARARDCTTICAPAEADVPWPVVDVALFCRTIDHVLDPVGVLTKLRAHAELLVVDAMDVTHWPASSRYKVDHPYAFTRATFQAVVAAAGWTPIYEWHRERGRYTGVVCRPTGGAD